MDISSPWLEMFNAVSLEDTVKDTFQEYNFWHEKCVSLSGKVENDKIKPEAVHKYRMCAI